MREKLVLFFLICFNAYFPWKLYTLGFRDPMNFFVLCAILPIEISIFFMHIRIKYDIRKYFQTMFIFVGMSSIIENINYAKSMSYFGSCQGIVYSVYQGVKKIYPRDFTVLGMYTIYIFFIGIVCYLAKENNKFSMPFWIIGTIFSYFMLLVSALHIC